MFANVMYILLFGIFSSIKEKNSLIIKGMRAPLLDVSINVL